jgi:hypothetical protein
MNFAFIHKFFLLFQEENVSWVTYFSLLKNCPATRHEGAWGGGGL